jgi:hypothetical protein
VGPGLSWHLEPLEPGAQSTIDITLSEDSSSEDNTALDDYGLLNQMQARLRAARPQAASWINATLHHEALHVFDQTPAGQIALKWINDDLTKIGWHE